jgi:polyisoprenoid-binding protein YceI
VSQTETTRQIDGIELPPKGTWKLDQAHTMVSFVARHILTKTRGRFTDFDGTIVIGEGPDDSSVEVEIKTASIMSDTTQRDEHLRSGDFLEVEEYPVMTFKSTAVRPKGGNRFDLVGELTIKDITNEVVLDSEFEGVEKSPFGTTVMSFSAKTRIRREDWDMNWNVALETGGLLVSKEVDIELDVEAVLEQ